VKKKAYAHLPSRESTEKKDNQKKKQVEKGKTSCGEKPAPKEGEKRHRLPWGNRAAMMNVVWGGEGPRGGTKLLNFGVSPGNRTTTEGWTKKGQPPKEIHGSPGYWTTAARGLKSDRKESTQRKGGTATRESQQEMTIYCKTAGKLVRGGETETWEEGNRRTRRRTGVNGESSTTKGLGEKPTKTGLA